MSDNKHIVDYLRGKQRGRGANRVEREAMRDPLLSEALEGYGKHEGNHVADIIRLQQAVALSAQRRKNTLWWAAAACIVALLGISTFFFLRSSDEQLFPAPAIAESVDSTMKVVDTSQVVTLLAVADERKPAKPQTAPQARAATTKQISPAPEVATEMVAETKDETIVIAQPSVAAVADVVATQPRATEKAIPARSSGLVVQGIITDVNNSPLPGITVIVEGTRKVALSDIYGNFSIEVNSMDDKLQAISFGMQPTFFKPDTSAAMLIAMREEKLNLDEVVVTAMGLSRAKKSMEFSASEQKKYPSAKPEIGDKAYLKYIKNNLRYPVDSTCADNLSGRVVLRFYVDASGRPYDIEVAQSLCGSYDDEAIRLIKEGSNWQRSEEQVEYSIEFKKK